MKRTRNFITNKQIYCPPFSTHLSSYSKSWVRFWAATRSIASSLLERRAVAGEDYAITEIVRCKSVSEIGVQEAKKECMSRFLERTLELSPARLVVCLGDKVSDVVRTKYKVQQSGKTVELQMGGCIRTVLFLPHPNARKERKVEKLFSVDELRSLRERLK